MEQIFYPLTWLAVIGAGGCVAGNNPSLTPDELVHHFHITSPRFVVAHADFLESLLEATEQCHIPREHIFILGASEPHCAKDCPLWDTLLEHGEADWLRFDENSSISSNSIAVLASTSGTTGLPKCAELSQAALVAQCEMIAVYNRPKSREVCTSRSLQFHLMF